MTEHDPLCPQRDLNHYEVASLIARVRADERAKCLCYSSGAPRPSDLLAHAEAVAARLVEDMRRERDAARAEVAALRDEVARLEARWLARTPSYAVDRDSKIRREVLADLRDKVSSGWVPELDHEARIAVLALARRSRPVTAPDPAWVEAGARASAQWHRNEDAWDSDDRALAHLILSAALPLICEQIAAEIEEAERAAHAMWRSTGEAYWEGRADALEYAERIARGDAR